MNSQRGKISLLVIVVLSMLACSSETPAPTTTDNQTTEPKKDAFEVWAAMRQALHESPDNLRSRAQDLVAEADPIKLYEFVRDEIRTYPTTTNGFDQFSNAEQVRWGIKGTLRGGAGTPREKAELLNHLYQLAGFESEVVRGPSVDGLDGRSILLTPVMRQFQPNLDPKTLKNWLTALGVDTDAAIPFIDGDYTETYAQAQQLADQLDVSSLSSGNIFSFETVYLPLVKVKVSDEWQFANPVIPGGEFGNSYTSSVGGVYSQTGLQNISVKLEAIKNTDLSKPFTLLDRTFQPDDVVGRRIHLHFQPVASLEELSQMKRLDIEGWIPTLTVQGPDIDATTADSLSVIGDVITRTGDRYSVAEDGSVSFNGVVMVASDGLNDDRGTVTALEIDARTENFPNILLNIRAVNELGEAVAGLGLDAFSVEEDNQAMGVRLYRNQPPPPRVLIIFDNSSSVPETFRNTVAGNNATQFGISLINAILQDIPETLFNIMTIGETRPNTDWTADLTVLQNRMDGIYFYESSIWQALEVANKMDPTIIVLVSDFDSTDQFDGTQHAEIILGSPVVGLGAGVSTALGELTLQQIIDLTNGVSATVTDHNTAVNAVTQYLQANGVPATYSLNYTALENETNSPRNITLGFDNSRLSQSLSYTPPPIEQRSLPPRLAGLTLTITVGNSSKTRTIAGLDINAREGDKVAAVDEVERSLLGNIQVAVEASAPPLSLWLEDWYSEKLSFKPLLDAYSSYDSNIIKDAIEQGYLHTPKELFLLTNPLPAEYDPNSVTFELNLRVVTYMERPRFPTSAGEESYYEQQIDIFPNSKWATLVDDPTVENDAEIAWRKNLQRTLYLAKIEQFLFSDSTLGLIKDEPLLIDYPISISSHDFPTPEIDSYWVKISNSVAYNTLMAVPANKISKAYWTIDPDTGTVIGMLANGSGGGDRQDFVRQFNETIDAIDLWMEAFPNQAALGAIEKKKAAVLYRFMIMFGTGEDPGPLDEPPSLCDPAQDLLGGLPGLGSAMDTISDIETVTGYLGNPTGIMDGIKDELGC